MHLVFVCACMCAHSSTSTQEVHSAKSGEWFARAVCSSCAGICIPFAGTLQPWEISL